MSLKRKLDEIPVRESESETVDKKMKVIRSHIDPYDFIIILVQGDKKKYDEYVRRKYADKNLKETYDEYETSLRVDYANEILEKMYRKDASLVKKIIEFIYSFQDETCLHMDFEKMQSNYKNLLCRYSFDIADGTIKFKNTFAPDLKIFKENITILGENSSKKIYKFPIKFDYKYIKEVYINYVLLNTLLIENPGLNLVFTYGIFVCKNLTMTDDKVNKKILCDQNTNILFYQEFAQGKTLHELLKNAQIDLPFLKEILQKVFETMIYLENSIYKIAHNDLHTDNIMVNTEDRSVKIIDWGLSSFLAETGTYYQPFFYDGYYNGDYNKKESFPDNHTASQDFYFLCIRILRESGDEEIKDFISRKLRRFLFTFDKTILPLTPYFIGNDSNFYLYNLDKITETKHVEQLKKYNYAEILNLLQTDEPEISLFKSKLSTKRSRKLSTKLSRKLSTKLSRKLSTKLSRKLSRKLSTKRSTKKNCSNK